MRTALVNGRLLTMGGLVSGQTLLLSGARIEALVDPADSRCRGAVTLDLEGQLLLPGFIDVQVNGGGGVLFNDDPSPESIRAIGAAHRRFGTTGFLPTLISDDLDTIGRAIDAVQSSLDAGMPGVLGIHIEGREPGIVGAALYDEKTWCGIIVDGHHVDPIMLKLALRCKRHDRFMLVTDAMPVVGSAEPTFILQGRTIRVVDGICRDENGTLAGTALDMAAAVRNAVSLLGLDIVEAARMASEYPAEFLGLGSELGRIAPGYRANLVLMNDDLEVQKTWIEGVASV